MSFNLEVIFWVIFFLGLVWLGALTYLISRILGMFKKLTGGDEKKDFKSIIDTILSEAEKEKEFRKEVKEKIGELELQNLNHFQKIGLIRYNPYSETGGNQSFILALLDGSDNGFIVTSLHSRESTRVFAKPVHLGKEAGYEFSKEELLAISEAKKFKIKKVNK